MKAQPDTIAAIATGRGEAGIAIVRVSGPQSLTIADRIFHCHGTQPSRRAGGTFVYGHVTQPGAEAAADYVDEAVLLIFRAPRSYTCEDVVEIQGHGGRVCARRILQAALDAGARLAEPGEFTRRAFLSGRIDLLQAEAVLDLIRAQSDRAACAALEQLEGRLSDVIDRIYDELLDIGSNLEASLDFPEDDIPDVLTAALKGRLTAVRSSLREVVSTWQEGHLLREGVLVAIVGRPNVGKSTLMNSLLGKERSIVTEAPGTTRDTIEENLIIDGIPIILVDTAGIRDADCKVEIEGVRRAMSSLNMAEIVIFVVDASEPITTDEIGLIERIGSRRCIVVMNKTDLGIHERYFLKNDFVGVKVSLIRGDGVEDIRRALGAKLMAVTTGDHRATISERHKRVLLEVDASVEECEHLADGGREETVALIATAIQSALGSLGSLNGRSYSSELLESVFSKFCIGK